MEVKTSEGKNKTNLDVVFLAYLQHCFVETLISLFPWHIEQKLLQSRPRVRRPRASNKFTYVVKPTITFITCAHLDEGVIGASTPGMLTKEMQ